VPHKRVRQDQVLPQPTGEQDRIRYYHNRQESKRGSRTTISERRISQDQVLPQATGEQDRIRYYHKRE